MDMVTRAFFDELNRKLGLKNPTAEEMTIVGAVRHRLFGPDGRLKQEGMVHNLVTSVGDMFIAQFLAFVAGATVGSAAYMQLGVGTAAPAKADTSVTSILATSSRGWEGGYPQRVNSFSGAGEWTLWRSLWPAGASTCGSIGEVGMWSSVGSFLAHAILAPNVPKGANDSLQVDWGWKFLGA